MACEKFIGVDGCKGGWFFVAIGPHSQTETGVCETIKNLWHRFSEAKWILIDIPIGLPSKIHKTRQCDKAARQVLSPARHHSIFSPPCREALAADNYPEACRINQLVCGRRISIQTWHISPKIKEVDDLLATYPEARNNIRETHPEICFWALAGKKAMVHYKKRPEGQAERHAILNTYLDQTPALVKTALNRYPRRLLARDDIHDAMINAVTACRLDESMETLPSVTATDKLGLPMQMVFSPITGRGK